MRELKSANNVYYSMIYNYILRFELETHNKQLIDISRRNIRLGANNVCFMHNGVVYLAEYAIKGSKAAELKSQELINEVNLIQKSITVYAKHREYISHCLSFLVKDWFDYQDFRDVLSDDIVKHLPPLAKFNREKEPYFSIKNEPNKIAQWMKAEEYIELYLAYKLIGS